MAVRRRHRHTKTPASAAVAAVSVFLCMARCKAYADNARAKRQDGLADVYEGFQLLLQEYAEDLGAGIVGRVEIDPVTF